MTGTQIRSALKTRLNRTDTVIPTNSINDQITAALRRIARMALWPDLHETDSTTLAFTSGDESKAMPSDFEPRGLDRIYITDDRTLVPMAPDALRSFQDVANADTGEPEYYAIIGGNCYVTPIPDASYTVKFDHWAIPAAVSDETATLVLGDSFQEAVTLATIVAYLNDTAGLGTHPKVAESEQKFYAEMATLIGMDDRKPTIVKAFAYGD